MKKKVLILKGSPRKKGNSSTLADNLALGAQEQGAEVETIFLEGKKIHTCTACDQCGKNGKDCVFDDDMRDIYPKLRWADGIVIASPIYWFTMSAQMKLCIDRWYAMDTPQGNQLRGKQIGIILTYGDSDPYTSGAINAINTFQSMFRYIGSEIAGMVYGTASNVGDVQKQPALMEKAFQLGKKLASSTAQ
jgi:multimeric flavodoxin WrbA